jgi:hypothetical protein
MVWISDRARGWALLFAPWSFAQTGLGQATRRFDVDTKWLQETGVLAAKDHMTVKDYLEIENQSEEKLDKFASPH